MERGLGCCLLARTRQVRFDAPSTAMKSTAFRHSPVNVRTARHHQRRLAQPAAAVAPTMSGTGTENRSAGGEPVAVEDLERQGATVLCQHERDGGDGGGGAVLDGQSEVVAVAAEIVEALAHVSRRHVRAILDLPLPDPPPKGSEWIDAYRRWARGR